MSKKKKIILTVVCIVLLVLIVIGAVVLYKMSITTEGWGPGDFPMPDNSIRIICERIVTYHT